MCHSWANMWVRDIIASVLRPYISTGEGISLHSLRTERILSWKPEIFSFRTMSGVRSYGGNADHCDGSPRAGCSTELVDGEEKLTGLCA
jgi:hypothetical protein